MPKVQPGTFYRDGREYVTLSEASRRLGLHPLDFHDAEAYEGLSLHTVAGCKCIAVDDLDQMKGGAK